MNYLWVEWNLFSYLCQTDTFVKYHEHDSLENGMLLYAKTYISVNMLWPLIKIDKRQKQPNCSLMDEWINEMCVYSMDYHSALKEEGSPDTCYHKDEA